MTSDGESEVGKTVNPETLSSKLNPNPQTSALGQELIVRGRAHRSILMVQRKTATMAWERSPRKKMMDVTYIYLYLADLGAETKTYRTSPGEQKS
jgi:hypothetical protein